MTIPLQADWHPFPILHILHFMDTFHLLFPPITDQSTSWPLFSVGEPVDGILRACVPNAQRAAS
jgi:hypothetical protein